MSQKKTLASSSKHPNLTMHLLRFFLLLVLFLVFHYVGNIHVCLTLTPSPLPPSSEISCGLHDTENIPIIKRTVFLDKVFFHLLILILWLIFFQYQAWLHMCSNIHYVPFDTNLNILKRNKNSILTLCSCLWYSSAGILALFLLTDYETNFIHILIGVLPPNFDFFLCLELFSYILSKYKKLYQ